MVPFPTGPAQASFAAVRNARRTRSRVVIKCLAAAPAPADAIDVTDAERTINTTFRRVFSPSSRRQRQACPVPGSGHLSHLHLDHFLVGKRGMPGNVRRCRIGTGVRNRHGGSWPKPGAAARSCGLHQPFRVGRSSCRVPQGGTLRHSAPAWVDRTEGMPPGLDEERPGTHFADTPPVVCPQHLIPTSIAWEDGLRPSFSMWADGSLPLRTYH